jgi:hypothetical protein
VAKQLQLGSRLGVTPERSIAMTHRSTDEIAEDVLSYFLRNPQAADNLEGIARWRLLSEAIHRTVEQTSQVLEWLVSQGVLLKVTAGGSEPVYCLNRGRRADAEALLAKMLRSGGESKSKKTPDSLSSQAPRE